jgi:hypothetical protein
MPLDTNFEDRQQTKKQTRCVCWFKSNSLRKEWWPIGKANQKNKNVFSKLTSLTANTINRDRIPLVRIQLSSSEEVAK